METLLSLGILAYLGYEINRRTKQDQPIETDVDPAEIEAPTPSSANPIIVGAAGHIKRHRREGDTHKEVFSRVTNIKPISPLQDLQQQNKQTRKDVDEHNNKSFDRLIID